MFFFSVSSCEATHANVQLALHVGDAVHTEGVQGGGRQSLLPVVHDATYHEYPIPEYPLYGLRGCAEDHEQGAT